MDHYGINLVRSRNTSQKNGLQITEYADFTSSHFSLSRYVCFVQVKITELLQIRAQLNIKMYCTTLYVNALSRPWHASTFRWTVQNSVRLQCTDVAFGEFITTIHCHTKLYTLSTVWKMRTHKRRLRYAVAPNFWPTIATTYSTGLVNLRHPVCKYK